jgi:hypothetical protein
MSRRPAPVEIDDIAASDPSQSGYGRLYADEDKAAIGYHRRTCIYFLLDRFDQVTHGRWAANNMAYPE